MAYPVNGRTPVQDKAWFEGCNSLIFPTDILPGYYYWAENCVNRGGVIQTRPGRHLLFSLPGKNAQGLGFYRPYHQKEQLVWAIDGLVYASEYPFKTYKQVPNIKFYKTSPQVFFCQARQAQALQPDGTLVSLPTPVDILFMQDGYSASAFYQLGTDAKFGAPTSGHNKAILPFAQCPVGTCMAFMGGRLWVANDDTIYASDLMNPNSFTERAYLAEADGFKLPERCTGLLPTAQNDPAQAGALYCFTPFTITALQANILDRTQWQTTQGFQTLMSADIGSVSPFSPTNQWGIPWCFSERGAMSLDEATNQYRTSRINPKDNEMTRSRLNMSPIQSRICSIAYENWLLFAVPSGSKFNRHTWVLDGAPMVNMNSQAGPCWAGIWTGTYPVQFVTGEVQDVPRVFELAYSCSPDASGNRIHLWEDFTGRCCDTVNGKDTPIFCSWETKMFEVSQIGELIRFKFVEIDIVELVGHVHLEIYYGGIKGHYRKILDVWLSAEEGMPGNTNYPVFDYSKDVTTDTVLDSFRRQVRTVRTPDYSGAFDEADGCSDTCGTESDFQHNVDKAFQVMVNWRGRMGIRELRMFVEPYAQKGIGECTPDELDKTNIVSSTGCLPPPANCNWAGTSQTVNSPGPTGGAGGPGARIFQPYQRVWTPRTPDSGYDAIGAN